LRQYPIIPCNLCGSQPNLQRQAMKTLLSAWEQSDPSRIASMLTALGNVAPSHLLDQQLYDFDTNTRVGSREEESPDTSAFATTRVAIDDITLLSTKEFPVHHKQ